LTKEIVSGQSFDFADKFPQSEGFLTPDGAFWMRKRRRLGWDGKNYCKGALSWQGLDPIKLAYNPSQMDGHRL